MLSNQQPYIIIKKGIVMNNDQKIKIRNFDYLNKKYIKGENSFYRFITDGTVSYL